MASVIRIKRRRGEDPAEALLLSCKRLRTAQEDEQSDSKVKSVLSFAGTISSKSEPVSSHIKEAIKQRKLDKQVVPDFKHAPPRASLATRKRTQNAQACHNNRYRVLAGRRALDLSDLDTDLQHESVEQNNHKKLDKREMSTDSDTDLLSQTDSEKAPLGDSNENSSLAETHKSDPSPAAKPFQTATSGSRSHDEGEFCIFDVEEEEVEKSDPFFGVSQQSTSGIMCNNQPMVCRKAEPEPTDDSQFVYDLYYTHSSLADLDLAAALTVEALADSAFLSELGDREGCDGVEEEDSEDSNDESNWRNDYPDEDPHFFENEDYDYGEDMVDTGYLNDDETDLLSYWMDSRCNVATRSDDDEAEYGSEGSDELD